VCGWWLTGARCGFLDMPSIFAVVPTTLLERLRAAAGRELKVHSVAPEAVPRQKGEPGTTWVIDPSMVTHDPHKFVRSVVAGAGPDRVVLYMFPNAIGVRWLPEFVRAGVRHLLVAGVGDTPSYIRQVLHEVGSDSLSQKLVGRLSVRLALLPDAFRHAVVDSILRPEEYRNVQNICEFAGAPRRTCDRWFARSELASLARLRRVARSARAIGLLRNTRLSLSRVAARLGWSSARQLSLDVRRIFSAPPKRIARWSEERILDALANYVC
jgi:AraC-like DNA-binding protein